MTTTLYLARHGETEENVAQILQGHLPGHLTERGRNQAVQLRNTLMQSGASFDALLTAPSTPRKSSTRHFTSSPCSALCFANETGAA